MALCKISLLALYALDYEECPIKIKLASTTNLVTTVVNLRTSLEPRVAVYKFGLRFNGTVVCGNSARTDFAKNNRAGVCICDVFFL